jgi:predicted ATPase
MKTKNFPLKKRIVLSGGPGVGKTSIINLLSALGYRVGEEVFTTFFREAYSQKKLDQSFLRSPELIQNLINLQKKIETDKINDQQSIFLDRSRVDIWGYCQSLNLDINSQVKNEIESGQYDLVFMVEPLPEKYYQQNEIRLQDYNQSLQHHHRIIDYYQKYLKIMTSVRQYPIVNVPYQNLPFNESVSPCLSKDDDSL